ncbi:dipeptidase [Candidatus Marinamargulisbacteria bacterium SCGC AG-439-L15]|nr:dipeptidase [Candidatus Marinamargulisbacteria bacterium SCGC AG-439-L15]
MIKNNAKERLTPLLDWLKFPSISGDPKYHQDLDGCAKFIASYLQGIGLETVEIHKTPQHPIVYAEHCQSPGKPTVLIYGHYDVQPVDPLELWDTKPFDPTEKDGYIYARGVADNKGQIFCHLKALELILKEMGSLPVNVKILIEGEEEIGSPNLSPFIEANKEKLRADCILISDNPMYGYNQPSLCVSLRGISYLELTLSCLSGDLHSGQHGGAAPNAIHELISLLSQLKDPETGEILIPGFYDGVRPISGELKTSIEELSFDEKDYGASIGAKSIIGESGHSVPEKLWYRPSLDINGIWGGFTEDGAKTVIPAKASAKLSMRLVGDQDPMIIQEKTISYLKEVAPDHVTLSFKPHHGCQPAQLAIDGPFFDSAKAALKHAFGVEPVIQGEGGSIPIVAEFQRILGVNTVMMGLNNTDDNIHAPNERMRIENIEKGIQASRFFLDSI